MTVVALSDTIAALSTPVGTAGLAVLRVSGPLCADVFEQIFSVSPKPRWAHYADYRTVEGQLLDDVVAIFFAGPRSYSGEDALEISCHGNPLIAQKILEDLLRRGCRAAEPGEFTRRAFINGRLDLTQAEAVIDLIHAHSERALEVANQQLRGSLGRHVENLTEALLGLLARIEAYIDFPEEDLPPDDRSIVLRNLMEVSAGADRLLATQAYGNLVRDGIKAVIFGAPNAGKSSLLNRLVGSERALVSAEPGTTRDYLEERVVLGPHCIRFIDTAGLNPQPGAIEKLGMEKTMERLGEADLYLWVVDVTAPAPPLPEIVRDRIHAGNAITIRNKVDLLTTTKSLDHEPALNAVDVSARTGQGIDALTARISQLADAYRIEMGDDTIAINARHADALRRVQRTLKDAQHKLAQNDPIELLASDLRDSLDALGEIGGKIDHERVLDHLFATFCIGK